MENIPVSRQFGESNKPKRNHKVLKRILFVFGGLLLAALVTNAVMFAAGFKTGFFNRWAEGQYFGRIAEINEGGFAMTDESGRKRLVLIKGDTRIRKGRQVVGEEALRAGGYVIVVGSPNDKKQIEARVIRIFVDDK